MVECNICPRHCPLDEKGGGACGAYYAEKNEVKEKYPHCWTTMNAVHIESIPFYHAYPGSRSLLLGSSGCNLDCAYCSNAYLARGDPSNLFKFNLPPEKVIDYARKTGCHNIVFGINEPTVSLHSLEDIYRKAAAGGTPMGCLTNGYMTKETAERISRIFSFINVSLKSISDSFYKKYAGVHSVQPVLENIKYFSINNHLEITTPIVQNINNDEIEEMADLIYSINPVTPWHVFRLLPEYKMKNWDYPAIDAINRTLETARGKLPFIYFSNFVGSKWVSTLCPGCGKVVIERINFSGCGGKLVGFFLKENICSSCGKEIPLYGKRVYWHGMEVVE
ncbi:MAG: radical SAM protein [Firmicutes bacterium]|nr:radical SAM protein [Bacillota bacterium]